MPTRARANAIRRVLVPVISITLVLGGLARAADTPAPAPAAGGTLVVGVASEPDSLNVYLARGAESMWVANRVLPLLAREIPPAAGVPGGFAPELARSWQAGDHGKKLTLKLRADRRWSDGAPVTCADLQYTLKAQLSADVAWRGASIKRHIVKIDCPDPASAVVVFDSAYPGQLMDVNDVNILPRSLASIPFTEWRKTDWSTALPSAGPFRIARWQPGQELVLERNPSWTGSAAPLNRVVLRVVPDATSRVTQLVTGGIDVAPGLSPDDAARLANESGVRIERRPDWGYVYVGWNTKLPDGRPHPLFADARVRRAMTQAIDREALVDLVLRGEGTVVASPILPPLPDHDPALVPLALDRERARTLLREAGFEDRDGDGTLDRGGRPFAFDLLVQAGNPVRRNAAVLIQQDLAKIGVAARIVPVENSSFYRTLGTRTMDAWVGSWRTSSRVDMTEMLHASSCTKDGSNFGCWSGPEADRIASAARDQLDDAARAASWRRWERIFEREQPYTILFRSTVLVGVRKRVQGTETLTSNDALAGVESWRVADVPGN